jgi:transitional endoplasmic reticulum ATPase
VSETTPNRTLPAWAEELRSRYLRGEAWQFVLHGNVHDLVQHGGRFVPLPDFLAEVLVAPTKDLVVRYDVSAGVRIVKGSGAALRRAQSQPADVSGLLGSAGPLDGLAAERAPSRVLPALERLLVGTNRVAVVIEYAEVLAPAAEAAFSSEADRQSVVTLHRWSMSPALERADNLVVLVAETLAELHPRIVSNPRTAAVKIPLPDADARAEAIRLTAPGLDAAWVERLADVTAGLRVVQIQGILAPPAHDQDLAVRERWVRELLGNAPDAEARAKKLAALTAGLPRDEIRALLAPGATLPDAEAREREEVLRLVQRRKREIIERECTGLVEFVEPRHGFDAVGGMDEVKRELETIAGHLRAGRRARSPMGLLFTGPMGTGKTFVAEAFVKEAGLPAVKLKNFRSKWVGATEGNLERILAVIQAMGPVIVIVDEGDRAFAGESGESDGGTTSRVLARLKEFMSDGGNRGRVLFIVMTNRPDLLDVDLKRAGRLDRKLPFFFAEDAEDVEPVLLAQLRRHGLATTLEFPRDRDAVSAKLRGWSNAELEAVVLAAGELAGDAAVTADQLGQALRDFLPSRDREMLEYMELVAVFESSTRRLLPKKYAEVDADELQARLNALRPRVRGRR